MLIMLTSLERPMELSQDPISPGRSDDSTAATPRNPPCKSHKLRSGRKITTRIHSGYGKIIIEETFRIPKKSRQSQSQRDSILLTPYSDGFVGKEGEPTGLFMPIKQSLRRKNLTSRIGELTLVATKLKEVMQGEPKHLSRMEQHAIPVTTTGSKPTNTGNHLISN